MRGPRLLAAAALAAVALQAAGTAGRADQAPPGPFPSPSPSAMPAAGNGYVALSFSSANSSGGQIPGGVPGRPVPFVSAGAGGFSLDALGRISETYLAALTYDSYTVRGDDRPFVSYSQGMLLFNPHGSNLAAGLGYLSMQRSTASVNMNGPGIGACLLPQFRQGASLYASAFFYPRLSSANGAASLTSVDAGLVFSPPKRGGFFYRVGAFTKNGGGAGFSPTQISGITAGIGAAF